MKKFNWQIWAGLLLSIFTFLSYPLLFVRFAVTRDFPWANLLFCGTAVVLLFVGVRRAFQSGPHLIRSKIIGASLATFGLVILSLFVFMAFIAARWIPPAHGAPRVGQKAPDFTLADTAGRQVSLAELLATPASANTNPKGVLLIFYRGYW